MTMLRVSSPAELLSAVPFLVGFHPADSLVVVGLQGPRIILTMRVDLPEHGTPEDEARAAVLHLATVVGQQQAEAVTIIGYGEEARVTPVVRHLSDAFREARLTVVDELRVTDGRYWSYLCEDLSCCPPEGRPCEPAFSVVATAATFAGAVALPSREALKDQLKSVTGDDRAAMDVATARAVLRLAALAHETPFAPDVPAGDEPGDSQGSAAEPIRGEALDALHVDDQEAPDLMPVESAASHPGSAELRLSNVIWANLGIAPPGPDEQPETTGSEEPAAKRSELLLDEDHFFALVRSAGRTAVQEAERCYRTGGRLTDDDAAWLGVLLLHMPVRDYAWTRTRTHEWELALWSDLMRRVEPRYLPAPASLLAFVAWRMGLGPLANVAVERALAQKLDYALANLMQGALLIGLPPSVLDGWPVVDGLPPIDDGLDSDDDPRRDEPVHVRPTAVTEPQAGGMDQAPQQPDRQDGRQLKSREGTEPDPNRPGRHGQLPVRVRSDAAPADARQGPGGGPSRREKRSPQTRRI